MMVPQNSHATCPNCQKNFGHMPTQMSGSMPQLWCVCRSQISICSHFWNFSLLWTQISNFGHFGHFDFGHKSTQKPWPMPQLWYFTLATSPRICGTINKITVPDTYHTLRQNQAWVKILKSPKNIKFGPNECTEHSYQLWSTFEAAKSAELAPVSSHQIWPQLIFTSNAENTKSLAADFSIRPACQNVGF